MFPEKTAIPRPAAIHARRGIVDCIRNKLKKWQV